MILAAVSSGILRTTGLPWTFTLAAIVNNAGRCFGLFYTRHHKKEVKTKGKVYYHCYFWVVGNVRLRNVALSFFLELFRVVYQWHFLKLFPVYTTTGASIVG